MTLSRFRVLGKDALDTLFTRLQSGATVLAPRPDATNKGRASWGVATQLADVDFDAPRTDMSPKDAVFPQTECLLHLHPGDADRLFEEAPVPEGTVVLLTIHPCDARALALLDTMFVQDGLTNDKGWRLRRERTLLVGLSCADPCPTCFCTTTGGGPHHSAGMDLLLTDLDELYLVEICSPRGEALTQQLGDCLSPATHAHMEAALLQQKQAEALLPKAFNLAALTAIPTTEAYPHPVWARLGETCLNCGSCTYVCPTCHCFDIQDEMPAMGHGAGRRVRNWDSCMSPLFTLHASGHNPRATRAARVRQRFLHKFLYIPQKRDGLLGCVGCGRCVRLCPVNIDIRAVARDLGA